MRRFLFLLLFYAPAHAGELLFLNPNRGQQQPARIEISTPEGGVCRKTARNGPELIVGGSYGRGAVLSGDNFVDEFSSYQEGATLSEGVPTFGVAIRIPLGHENIGSCQDMIQVLDVQTRVQVAEEMFEKGLITQEELESVASRAYKVLNNF